MKKIISLLALTIIAVVEASAQIVAPVTWTSSVDMTSDTDGVIVFKADIEKGWHLYGVNLPEGGPRSTVFNFDSVEGAELVGSVVPSEAPREEVDMIFHLKLSWWENEVEFRQKFKVTDKNGQCSFNGYISYQGCNDNTCIAPAKEPFELTVGGAVAGASQSVAADTLAPKAAVNTEHSGPASYSTDSWWAPVDFDTFSSGTDAQHSISQSSWWMIFIWGFVGGLLALLTPCVWPMIPLTVSFFLKKSGSRSKSVRDALIYGAAIVVIYLTLGMAITMIFGASKLNDLATNALFNLLFFALLVVFAVSFFGAFDIKLPSKWSNSVDNRAERTSGFLSIFFMAFTLALVSFSCTGPIIGTLLVEAASMGDVTGPAIGMGAFALALAVPFALFAMFPSWLKEMPRSGGWLNSVKVVLGFLELALSLKFLSVADLAYGWGILDREVFVSLWIVIFVLLGLYLLGKICFSHDAPLDYVSLPRFFLALVSFSFSVYLLPGLWGAPLKGVSAFVPPLYTQDFNLYEGGEFRAFHDYDEGMKFAAEQGRPVLIDFSGYGCVNCRKMEGAVFDTQEVSSMIKENFVLITLMVDDKKSLPEPITVEENGKKVKLETIGDKWSYLQRGKFRANSQPYYVMLDNDGAPLGTPYYYDEDVAKFVQWLESGINNYSEE
ncbi:MAG: thioredoxin family protein [Muribaculaceae bacterium]|nr:thioredoxin family protein [Muribaculaceae bacterium]